MTTTRRIPNAKILHTCLFHHCRFVVLDITKYIPHADICLVFLTHNYVASQHVTKLWFTTAYNLSAPSSASLKHVFLGSTQFKSQYHTRYLFITYDIIQS